MLVRVHMALRPAALRVARDRRREEALAGDPPARPLPRARRRRLGARPALVQLQNQPAPSTRSQRYVAGSVAGERQVAGQRQEAPEGSETRRNVMKGASPGQRLEWTLRGVYPKPARPIDTWCTQDSTGVANDWTCSRSAKTAPVFTSSRSAPSGRIFRAPWTTSAGVRPLWLPGSLLVTVATASLPCLASSSPRARRRERGALGSS